MFRGCNIGGVCVLAMAAFLAGSADSAMAWNHKCCDNGRYYLGGNGYRGCGWFVCGEHFSGGWQGGPNGGTVGLGYINTAYFGTLGDVKAGRISPAMSRNGLPSPAYGTPVNSMPPVQPVPGPTPSVPPTPIPDSELVK